MAKPPIKAGQLEPWREHMTALAGLPNVVGCKVSGLVTEADQQRWTTADLAPYVAHVLQVFGEQRVMFGGDWPVVTHASTYLRWVEALRELSADLSPEAGEKLWRANATRIYRLNRSS
jgi:L-fuconolactonase